MINWQSVIFNSLWISGLALLLAAFSYYYWEASQSSRTMREQLSRPEFLRFFWLAILLVSIGLVGTSQQSWEIVLWSGFAIIALLAMAALSRSTAA